MPDRRYESVEEQQAREVLDGMSDIPRPIRSALSHVLSATAIELSAGRPVPIEMRRAVRHVEKAVREVEQG